MTVGGWVFFVFIAVTLLLGGVFTGSQSADEKTGAIVGGLIGLIISMIILGIMLWYYNSTASGARAFKSQQSNFNMGIERKVTVYDIEGDVIQEYEGKFDIEYDDDRILFDDENGKRHIIYYPTGTVIIDEVG